MKIKDSVLKTSAKETSGALIHVYSFWKDFLKPLREREPDSLHIVRLHVWQPHVLWPVGTWVQLKLCHFVWSSGCPAPGQQHAGPLRTTWHGSPQIHAWSACSLVKTESYLHSSAGKKTFLCDHNSPKSSVLFVPHTSTAINPTLPTPCQRALMMSAGDFSPIMVPKTPVQSKQIVPFDKSLKSWKQSYWNKK